MAEHLGAVAIQTLVVALAVEALLRLWEVVAPAVRLPIRLLVVLLPVLLWPALELLAAFGHGAGLDGQLAVLAGAPWSRVRVAGVPLTSLWLGACVVLSTPIVLIDLLPFLRQLTAGTRLAEAHPGAPTPRLAKALAALDVRRPPTLVYLETPHPMLFCRGVWRPRVHVSRGTVDLLDDAELRAAMAHELAHIARRDVLLGWGLALARLVQPWNLALHFVVRAIARDLEWRADDAAACRTGDPLAVASGLLRIHEAVRRETTWYGGRWQSIAARTRELGIEERSRRLLHGAAPMSWSRTRVVLAGVLVVALALVMSS